MNKLFRIDNFSIGQPITMRNLNNEYLTVSNNHIFFSNEPTQWIIESDENGSYIKYNTTTNSYIGCPNSDNKPFLYTSKNKFTRWTIEHIQENIYLIKYSGEKFDTSDICIVIARYDENIEWALAYNDICIIYNKGHPIETQFRNIIQLNNIGREGNTYLHHIISNYNKLSNFNIFIQADPFPHNNTILFGIDNYFRFPEIQPLGLRYLESINIPSIELLEKYKIQTEYGLNYAVFPVDNNLRFSDFYDAGIEGINESHYRRYPEDNSICEGFLKRSKFPIEKTLDAIPFTFCALFSISSSKIRQHDISIYQNLIRELTIFYDQGGDNGYILERLWLYIFGYQ